MTEKRELSYEKVFKAARYACFLQLVSYRIKDIKVNFEKAKTTWNDLSLDDSSFYEFLSQLLKQNPSYIKNTFENIISQFKQQQFNYDILELSDKEYPALLRNVPNPPPFLFVRGDINLFKQPTISVVGTRTPSDNGVKRAARLAALLAEEDIVVVSGLAKGIDTAAHAGSLRMGGQTIAVIGTPIDKYYPSENQDLQTSIAETNLLVSQFPFSYPITKYNFPIRNYTMSGISLATVIVEAKQGSGALYQAKDALRQNRKLFIMKHIFDEPDLEWPETFRNKPGVYILSQVEDLLEVIYQEPKAEPQSLQCTFDLQSISISSLAQNVR